VRSAVLAIAVAGCFGGNSSNVGPSEATVVFALPDTGTTCAPNSYVGDVAFAGGSAVAVVSPDAQVCNQSGNNQDASTSFVTFQLDGPNTGSGVFATQPVGGIARVAWLGDQPMAAFAGGSVGTDGGVDFQLGAGSMMPVTQPGGTTLTVPGNAAPATIVSDGSGAWMAIWPQPLLPFDDASYPNGQDGFSPQNNNGGCSSNCNGFAVFNTDGSIRTSFVSAEQWFCNEMPDCLAQNSTTVFGMVRGDDQSTGMAQVVGFSKGSGNADADFQAFATIPNAGNSGPTGLAADDAHVIWTLAPDVDQGAIGCAVFALDLNSGSNTQILMTDAFSCAGAAVDSSAAYVAITRPANNSDTGNGDTITGLGLARIGFDGTFASISTGTPDEPYAGPRRVYVLPGSPEQIVAVDPHAVGLIAASAFDGRTDIPQ
jgi:hypothetical protein